MIRLAEVLEGGALVIYHVRNERAVPSTRAWCSWNMVVQPAKNQKGPVTCLRCLALQLRFS